MFDPFGDFATRGYLRNLSGDTDARVVKAAEHNFFEANIEDALEHLAACGDVSYADFLEVHRIVAMSETEVIQDAGKGRHVVWSRVDLDEMDLVIGESMTIHPHHRVKRPRSKNGLGR